MKYISFIILIFTFATFLYSDINENKMVSYSEQIERLENPVF